MTNRHEKSIRILFSACGTLKYSLHKIQFSAYRARLPRAVGDPYQFHECRSKGSATYRS